MTPPEHPDMPAMRALAQLVSHLCRASASIMSAVRAGASATGVSIESSVASALPDALVRRHMLAPLASTVGIARFRKDYIASALMAELRERTLGEVAEALEARAVPVMLFKGIAYPGTVYADPAERPMSDIDIMVPIPLFERAAQVLRQLGFWTAGPARQASRLHHALTFKRKDAAVDLHRSVMQPLRSRIDLARIWRDARPVPGRPGVLRPADVDLTVLHLAHMARHELRVPAINYIDAARLLAWTPGGVEAVLARARDYRLRRGVIAAVAMTEALAEAATTGVTTGATTTTGASARTRVARGNPWRSALASQSMPTELEVLADQALPRARQLVRKLLLVDGPRELLGLLWVGAVSRVAHRFRS